MAIRVGFIGVGHMGGAMAGRAAESGLPVTVYDLDAAAASRLAAKGARVADSPRAVAECSDLVSVVVLDDAQVREVLAGPEGVLEAARPGLVVAIHSTIHVSTLLEVAERARRRDVEVVDAAVTGGPGAAEKGELTVMLGGDEKTIERLRPAFEIYGGLVRRVGALGQGMTAKLARNLIQFVQLTAAYEGMRLAEAAGVDLAALSEIVRYSDARAGLLYHYLARPTAQQLRADAPEHAELIAMSRYVAPLAEKDLDAALERARELDLDLPATRLGRELARAIWGIASPA